MTLKDKISDVTMNPFCGTYPGKSKSHDPLYLFDETTSLEAKLLRYKKEKAENLYIQSEKPLYYIYRIKGRCYNAVGLIGLVPHKLFENGFVFPHEQTLKRKELDYSKSLCESKVQINPVLLFYKNNDALTLLLKRSEKNLKQICNMHANGFVYEVAPILDDGIMMAVRQNLKNLNKLYIADGHHRINASILAAKKHTAMPRYCLSMLLPAESIMVGSINRGIKSNVKLEMPNLLARISPHFGVEKVDQPELRKHSYGMYIKNQWYQLTAKKLLLKKIGVKQALDPLIVQEFLLKHIFDIQSQRTSSKLKFIPDYHDNSYLEDMVCSGDVDVAISIPPIDIADLCDVADAGSLVPPHSTYLRPKPLNGTICWEY